MQLSNNQTIFYHLLGNTLLASVTNAFVWFALTFWVFLETRSVLATAFIAGIFAVSNMAFAFLFGSIVDHHKKRTAMLISSVLSLVMYAIGAAVFFLTPREVFTDAGSIQLWVMVVFLMLGSVAGNLRVIALSTVVTQLFAEGRDKANGMIGTVNGLSFSLTSVLSGLAIGFFDLDLALICAIIATVIAFTHLFLIRFTEHEPVHEHHEEESHDASSEKKRFDIAGTIKAVSSVPGLFALIFFTTFNNFLGGVFMALMDAYGLSLVSVEMWGLMFAVLSLSFIGGSAYIARYGLGSRPLRTMLLINVITWTTCIFFTIQPSIILLGIGMAIWMTLAPFVEATEQTVIQAVVPYKRQGRVFGFAQSIESAATPITAFLIGPIAQFIFIPFMTTGAGVGLIGGWFGVGMARGIALVFIISGIIGLIVTLLALRSRAYAILSKQYLEATAKTVPEVV